MLCCMNKLSGAIHRPLNLRPQIDAGTNNKAADGGNMGHRGLLGCLAAVLLAGAAAAEPAPAAAPAAEPAPAAAPAAEPAPAAAPAAEPAPAAAPAAEPAP